LAFSREKKLKFFIEVLVLLSLGLAVATHASNVNAPSPAPRPLCGYDCSTYYTNYYPGPYCGETFQDTVYRAIVDAVSADKQTYSPGDTVSISGTVEVQSYTYYYDSCQCYNRNPWVQADPATASVVLELFINSDWTAVSSPVSPDSSGNFVLTYQVPSDQPLGTLSFRVTARPSQTSYGNSCSPLLTPDAGLGHKTVQVSIQTIPPSIALVVTPMSGCAPFTPDNMSYTLSGGKGPFTVIVYFGDGGSLDVSPGKLWPAHTYSTAGTFTVQITATDAAGKTASDSKAVVVNSCATVTPSVTSTSQSASLITAITGVTPPNVCDPALPIVMLIVTILVAVLIVRVLTRWIIGRLPFRTRLIVAIVVAGLIWFFLGAILVLGPGGVCNPAIIWFLAIILIVFVIVLFRNWFIGPARPPGRLPPNVTGNATLTQPNGNRTQLTNRTVNQITRGSKIETGNRSFIRMQTPQGSNSQTTIGENSSLSWLDQSLKASIPWLRLPGLSQIHNLGSVLLRLDFGKLLVNWVESPVAQEAVIALPIRLIGVGASEAMDRWLARVKGTMLLVEANRDGTAAAITVLEDAARASSVELWRSDELGKVIEIHGGERVILKAGQCPTKMSGNLVPGLLQQVEDPFNVLHRWWTLPPASDESITALGPPSIGGPRLSSGTTGRVSSQPQNVFCSECGQRLPSPNSKFCTKCGAEQANANAADKCAHCGEPLRPGKKFCAKCGTPRG